MFVTAQVPLVIRSPLLESNLSTSVTTSLLIAVFGFLVLELYSMIVVWLTLLVGTQLGSYLLYVCYTWLRIVPLTFVFLWIALPSLVVICPVPIERRLPAQLFVALMTFPIHVWFRLVVSCGILIVNLMLLLRTYCHSSTH